MTKLEDSERLKELYNKVIAAHTYVEWLHAQADYVEYASNFHDSIKIALMCVYRSPLCADPACSRTHVESNFTVWKDEEYFKKVGGIQHSLVAMLEFCKFDVIAKERTVLTANDMMPPDVVERMIKEQQEVENQDDEIVKLIEKARKPS